MKLFTGVGGILFGLTQKDALVRELLAIRTQGQLACNNPLPIKQFVYVYQIEELTLPMDKMTGIRKPFAFVGFDSEQAVEQLVAVEKHAVGTKMVS